ncbi:MAG: hypothetical protein H0T42_06970 [Deltaproteobacteria bacterium]|nr:hypothetical protein [Deltaproteobacteria bacterium]
MAVLPLVAALLAAMSAPAPDLHTTGINLYVGDLGAVAGYVPSVDGLSPAEAERERVRGHLRFAHDLLAAADTSTWPADRRAARARNLARLAAYADAGAFPHNDDHRDALRPTFVDDAGTLCAVGALYAADRGRGAAERIAQTAKYAFVPQIADADLHSWQATSGLSLIDLAIIQPAYRPAERANKMWLPFGLLDRIQFAPPRVGVTTEMGSADSFDTTRTTLHAQASTSCDCKFGAYGTLPMSYVLVPDAVGVAAAGGPIRSDTSRAWLGNGDVGLFAGGEGSHEQSVYRIGALLPTGSKEARPQFTSARVGDLVLDLPRSAGVRLSGSKMFGFVTLPSRWLGRGVDLAARVDFGVDMARETTNERLMHVIPRAGFGLLFARYSGTVSFDTVLALDPTDHGDLRTRFSAGVTGRLARTDGRGSWFHPALTLATVRTPEGWGATVAVDLAASARDRRRHDD